METQQSPVQETIHLERKKNSTLKHVVVGIFAAIGAVVLLAGLYVFVVYQRDLQRQEREKLEAQSIYDSIPTDFAHFTYKESSASATVIDMFYLKDELNNLSKEGTISAMVKVIIPKKTMTRDVHLEWTKNPKETKYGVFTKALHDADYTVTAVTTSENFVVLNIPKYKDVVVKIRACDAKNCVDSKELYIPQDQVADFDLFVSKQPNTASLSWQTPRKGVKFNIFHKTNPYEVYSEAIAHTKEKVLLVPINTTNDNYFIVQQCDTATCWSSNEVVLFKN